MVKLTHINPDTDATYHLTIGKGTKSEKKIAWCHPRSHHLEEGSDNPLGYNYAVEHDIPEVEAGRMAVPIRGKNLAIVEAKKKKGE